MNLFRLGFTSKKDEDGDLWSLNLKHPELMNILEFQRFIEQNKPKGFWFLSCNQADSCKTPFNLKAFYHAVSVSVNPPYIVLSGDKGNKLALNSVYIVERDTVSYSPLTVFCVHCKWCQKAFQYVLIEEREHK